MTDAEILNYHGKRHSFVNSKSIQVDGKTGNPLGWTDTHYRSLSDIAELERLRGENAKLDNGIDHLMALIDELTSEKAKLTSELKAARAKAEALNKSIDLLGYSINVEAKS